jgi:cytoskeleton protein RodZ
MQTIGERLEEARKKKGISIREAAEATKIRGDYLQKFESNHFDIGLTEIYTRGFLRTYANFLKLPADRIMSDYAALGRGDVRPRAPNREIYGRMDITVASTAEAADRAAPPDEKPAAEAAPARAQPHYPRNQRPALPSGPDPAVIFRWLKIGGAIVLVLILLWVVKSMFSGSSRSAGSTPATRTASGSTPSGVTAPPVPAERSITLVPLDTVFVRVTRLIPPDTDGDEIFKGTLNRGQRQVVSLPGPVNIWASAGENLHIEYNGREFPTGFTGYNHAQIK